MEEANAHCDAAQTLKRVNLSKTPQRVAVLSTLIRSRHPLNVTEILVAAGAGRNIDRTTVYRLLNALKGKGVIREIETVRGGRFYEMACMHNPVHPHFNCSQCGKMLCLEPLTISQVWKWLGAPHDFRIDQIHINMGGLCQDCQPGNNCNTNA